MNIRICRFQKAFSKVAILIPILIILCFPEAGFSQTADTPIEEWTMNGKAETVSEARAQYKQQLEDLPNNLPESLSPPPPDPSCENLLKACKNGWLEGVKKAAEKCPLTKFDFSLDQTPLMVSVIHRNRDIAA